MVLPCIAEFPSAAIIFRRDGVERSWGWWGSEPFQLKVVTDSRGVTCHSAIFFFATSSLPMAATTAISEEQIS
jgi:hypothetical protein